MKRIKDKHTLFKEWYGGIFPTRTCKINYVNMQDNYVNMNINMQDDYVNMNINMQYDYVDKKVIIFLMI